MLFYYCVIFLRCATVKYGEVIFSKKRRRFMDVFRVLSQIIILGLFGIGIYGFILFVKLANRGIKALDIYINEKANNKL